MFANVKIITEEKNDVITVPETAVLQRSNEQFVYKIVNDPTDAAFKIARRTTVTTGLSVDNMVEITSGLEVGDQIVTRGQTTFSDGNRVNIIQ
jgi:multidrug efflux pump subunit AcrA (membrane-fusion protein)